MARATAKYLAAHAEPEARGPLPPGSWDRALVVPACAESPRLVAGYEGAVATSSGSTLVIVVVNGRVGSGERVHCANEDLLRALPSRASSSTAWGDGAGRFASFERYDLLVVDRASDGRRLPDTEGVGLARKVGCDVALALWERQRLGEWIFWTDADAQLPDGHFDRIDAAGAADVAAAVFPYEHVPSGDTKLDLATALYETSLHYYVLGLRHAGSPYAFSTIGSTLAISAPLYAAVHGVPRRQAGEDFYLLNKLAKAGVVVSEIGAPVRITARHSARTPFGTGRAVDDIGEGTDYAVYAPETFGALGSWIGALDARARGRPFGPEAFSDVSPQVSAVMAQVATELGAEEILERLSRQAANEFDLRRRLHEWFDAFRTLRLAHTLRNVVLPKSPWRTALSTATFSPVSGAFIEGSSPFAIAEALRHVAFDRRRVLGTASLDAPLRH